MLGELFPFVPVPVLVPVPVSVPVLVQVAVPVPVLVPTPEFVPLPDAPPGVESAVPVPAGAQPLLVVGVGSVLHPKRMSEVASVRAIYCVDDFICFHFVISFAQLECSLT